MGEKPRGQKIIRQITEARLKIVREMYNEGYSYTQIQKTLGFKSINAVSYYIKKIKKEADAKRPKEEQHNEKDT